MYINVSGTKPCAIIIYYFSRIANAILTEKVRYLPFEGSNILLEKRNGVMQTKEARMDMETD